MINKLYISEEGVRYKLLYCTDIEYLVNIMRSFYGEPSNDMLIDSATGWNLIVENDRLGRPRSVIYNTKMLIDIDRIFHLFNGAKRMPMREIEELLF